MKTKTYACTRLALLCILYLGFSNLLTAQHIQKSLTAIDGTFIGFYEYKPVNYNDNPAKRYPLIIFLHGIGERGNGTTELGNLLLQGIPKTISRGGTMTFTNPKTMEKETFLVLSPQLSKSKGSWENNYVDAMLKYAKENLRIDTNKIFLTGLSLGGGGVWQYANTSVAHAKQFAAIAPVCGVCFYNYSTLCSTIGAANIGVWGFTNADDNIVSPVCTIQACDALAVCNPAKIKKTVYTWGGHDSWTKAYDTGHTVQTDINVYEWFLANAKGGVTPSPNQSPVANAGSPITIELPVNSVTLNGAASSDPDGSISTYNWGKVSGPSPGNIVNAGAASTSVTNLAEGIYTFRLTVTDNRGATASSTVQVTVNPAPAPVNKAPVANAGGWISITLPVNTTTLNGTASSDADGTISSYNWTKVSGPLSFSIVSASAATTNLTNLVQGIYVFQLTVTDNNGATNSATIQVTVHAAPAPVNKAPVANAGTGTTITLPVNTAELNGSSSLDPDGSIATYLWSKVSGPAQFNMGNTSLAKATVNNLVEGIYSFKLTVTDNQGASATATVQVTVLAAPPPANKPPVANAGGWISITLPVNATTLNGSTSSDADGTISSYNWTKVSGPLSFSIVSPSSSTTNLTNLLQGIYVFQLTVTDNNGATNSATVQVTVYAAPVPVNKPPVANAGPGTTITLPVNTAELNGSSSLDPDGSIATYLWSKVSGPAQFTMGNTSLAKATVNNLVEGVYSFKLTVTDNHGASATATVQVTVLAAAPAANKAPVANAGAGSTITLPSNSIALNGNASADPDGSIVSYNWSKISGPTGATILSPSAASTIVNNLVEGIYTFKLIVSDNGGATASATVIITVLSKPNTPPVANAGADRNVAAPAGIVTLDGSGSYDPDGQITAYSWKIISGTGTVTITNAASVKPNVEGMVAGEYNIQLTVTDNAGVSATDGMKILVSGAINRKPKADAGKDTSINLPDNIAVLNGAGSFHTDGTITAYAWRQLSGPAGAVIADRGNKRTVLSKLVEGEYVYALSVTDEKGEVAADTVHIMVINSFRITEYFNVYPNPARNQININYINQKTGTVHFTIYNIHGRQLMQKKVEKQVMTMDVQFDISDLKVGFYYVEVKFDDGKKLIKQFLKRG